MAVKLKGDTARTNPSSGRYSTRLAWGPGSDLCVRTMKQLRTSMYPRHSAVVAESKVLRRTSPQSGKSRQAKSENKICPNFSTAKPPVSRQIKKNADFRSSINLGLPGILPLSQDGGGHQLISILFADEICGLEKDGRAVVPWHSFPSGFGGECALDCPCDSCLICLMICANMPRMIRRNQLLGKLACLDLLQHVRCRNGCQSGSTYTKSETHRFPINDDRDLKRKLLLHLRDRGLQGCTFG